MSALVEKTLAFVGLLRANGLRVSTGEAEDALVALTACDFGLLVDRTVFHGVLSATLKKSAGEQDLFDRLFALHFRFTVELDAKLGVPLSDAATTRLHLDEQATRALAASMDAEREPLARALLAGDAARVLEIMRRILDDTDSGALMSPLQIPYFAQRVLSRGGAEAARTRLASRLREVAPDVEPVAIDALVDERMLALRRLAQQLVRDELLKRTLAREGRNLPLAERPLRTISPDDEARLREHVRRICERLRMRPNRRARRGRRGRLDLKATLRRSLGNDGVPCVVVRKRKRIERPDIVVLCDVSDSVRQASTFMLQFAYSLVTLFRRVRGFVFVDEIGEATDLFRRHGVDEAIARVMRGDVVSVTTNSDYGRALRTFAARHLEGLTRKTTVVVLGDGRTNHRAPEDWVVSEMRRRAKRVVWLCPEDEGLWGFGDSRMPTYVRHVDRVHVVRSLGDLSRAVDELLL